MTSAHRQFTGGWLAPEGHARSSADGGAML
jgi:hypothetical protein